MGCMSFKVSFFFINEGFIFCHYFKFISNALTQSMFAGKLGKLKYSLSYLANVVSRVLRVFKEGINTRKVQKVKKFHFAISAQKKLEFRFDTYYGTETVPRQVSFQHLK
jgi:hypothetical protein